MHGHDRLRPTRDPALDVGRIDVERHRVDVREDGGRAAPRDCLRSGVEREGRADHLVAGSDLHRVEDEHERVGAVRDADRLRDAEVGGGLILERLEVRALDQPGRIVENGTEARLELGDQGLVLRANVNERNRLHVASV